MRRKRFALFSSALLVLCVASITQPALAEQSGLTIDESRLSRYYDLYIQKNFKDDYLEKRIAEERTRIRGLIDEDMKKTLLAGDADATDLTKSIEKQRSLVAQLEQSLRERNVDLEILQDEEQKLYVIPAPEQDALEEFRLTKTHHELLAKKSVLEERIAAYESVLPIQRDRLSKLTWQQWLAQFGVFISIGSYLLILVAAVFIDRLVRKLLIGRIEQRKHRYLIQKIFTFTLYAAVVLWMLSTLVSEHPGVLASLAIVGAGIAVALQDVVKDVVGWIIILQKRYFFLGDRVAIGDFTGDVIDIGVFRTAMLEVGIAGQGDVLERTGKTLYLPNSLVLNKQVLNYNTTSDFTKAEMKVTVTYESDWKKAKEILAAILDETTKEHTERARAQYTKRTLHFYVSKEPADAMIYTDIADSGVTFTLRFNVPIGKRRDVSSAIAERILEEFAKTGIDIAYPTVRAFSESVSGKTKTVSGAESIGLEKK